MNKFLASLKPACISLFLLTILLGIVYPLLVAGIGQLFFHKSANGSLLRNASGKIVGSEWIGQNFEKPEYFHSRPSSAGDKGYDASQSSGSNLGPASKKLLDALTQRAEAYRLENHLAPSVKIPADAVASSGSGVDPHISVENARLQASRVAQARGLSQSELERMIEEHTEDPDWRLFGKARINVLLLNLALDRRS